MCSAQVGATSLGCDSSATKLLGQDSPCTITPSRVPRTAPEPTTAPRRQVARLTPRARRVSGRLSRPSEPREGRCTVTGRIADPWGPRTPYGRPGLAEPLVGRLPPVVRNRMPRRLTRRPWPVRVDTSGELPLLLTTGAP